MHVLDYRYVAFLETKAGPNWGKVLYLSISAKIGAGQGVWPQGQYWIEYLYLLLAAPPYMAAANFVVITKRGGCALTGTADVDQ